MKVKLTCNGGYTGIDDAIGKQLDAIAVKAGYLITATTLRDAGALPCMPDYIFFKSEVKVLWQK